MPTDLDAFLDRFEAQVAQIEAAAARHLGHAEPSDPLDVDPVDASDEALEAKDDFRAAVASVLEPLEQVMRGAVTVAQRRRLVEMRGRVEAVLANLSDD